MLPTLGVGEALRLRKRPRTFGLVFFLLSGVQLAALDRLFLGSVNGARPPNWCQRNTYAGAGRGAAMQQGGDAQAAGVMAVATR